MPSSYSKNDLLLLMMDALVGDSVDLEAAEKAFESAEGDFAAKFTAAVQARFAQLVVPEVFIELPVHIEELRKPELDALVRPAAAYLRSYPSKGELLDEASRIQRRQERRPAWIPRLDRNGEPIPAPETDSSVGKARPERPLVVTALPELGDVTVLLPADAEERPELPMAAGGIGEWEAALYEVLAVTGEHRPSATVAIDAQANEALVPEDVRWWSTQPARSLPATRDPGVASELLATSSTLGEIPVSDDTHEAFEAVATALISAGDWRYSPRWLLNAWSPGDDVGVLATARAAIAAWADEGRSGLIAYVYGGALHGTDGLIGVPGFLHTYLLCIGRSTDGTDTVDTVRRVILSCPGENWCHRGGCPDPGLSEAAEILTSIVTAGDAGDASDRDGAWAKQAHQRLYGAAGEDDYPEDVLDHLEGILSGAGWVGLSRSTWEGGLEESLLRRGEHCMTASYDPVTRQVRLDDGEAELQATLQMLADDGVLTGSGDQETVDTGEAAQQQWGAELLTAAEDLLRGRIDELRIAAPAQVTLLGMHPHADGNLHGPEATTLAESQLTALLCTAGVLSDSD
ncbi:hypothetical protein [Actinoallomurus acaciae]